MDIITKSLAKKYTNLVALGLSEVSVEGATITFTLNDGSSASIEFEPPQDGVSITDVEIDENKNLIVSLSDNTTINVGQIATVKGDKGDPGEKGADGIDGENGTAGINGASAYEIAVGNGFVGTQAEWLASLKGSSTMSGAASEIDAATLKGDIIPDLGGAYSIGTADKKLKSIYADEVYMSSNTLYINGTPVFHTDNTNDLMFTADEDQSIKVKTTGNATTNILSEQDIDIRTSAEASNVNICAGNVSTGTSSNANINASNNISAIANNQITNKAPNVILDGAVAVRGGMTVDNLSVSGNLTVAGDTLKVDADNLSVKDNIININDGETGNGVTAGQAGFKIDRGDYADYELIFDETDDMFKLGQIGNLQTIASQEYVDNAIENASTGDVDLTEYAKTTDVNTALNGYVKSDALNTKLGNYITSSNLNDNILPLYAKITDLHSHTNKTVLDKFSDDGNGLLYDGYEIGGGTNSSGTITKTTLFDGALVMTASSTANTTINQTITLSGDISDYDEIKIIADIYSSSGAYYLYENEKNITVNQIVVGNSSDQLRVIQCAGVGSTLASASFNFTTSDSIIFKLTRSATTDVSKIRIKKVIGIKY